MRQELEQNSYLHVPGFINPKEAEQLSNEFTVLKNIGICNLNDSQAPGSPSFYNFMPFVKLLVKKVPHISELVEEDVLPTYTYARIYSPNAVLSRHTDRGACEISVTLNLSQDAKWPIWIKKPSGEEVSLDLQPGDGMLYLGCTAEHWRDRFEGQEYSQMFLHYVRANGSKAGCFFDKVRV